jgi:hypothetical protein
MKELQVTLYDFFGYLLPGFVCLAAMTMSAGVIFHAPAVDLGKISSTGWIALSGIAYILGHLAQAFANLLVDRIPTVASLVLSPDKKGSLPKAIVRAISRRAQSILNLEGNVALDEQLIFDACDHWVQQNGRTQSRDIYVYREGFYRGLAISLLLFAFASLICVGRARSFLAMGEISLALNRYEMLVVVVISLLGARFSFLRYRRFGRYLVKYSLLSALINEAKTGDKKE